MRIITVAAHTRFYENDSTFSVRAYIIARLVILVHVSQLVFGGQLLPFLPRAATALVRPLRMSVLNTSIPVGTVLPFAVWYGRGEKGKYP